MNTEKVLLDLLGAMKAQRMALEALIASHPAPEQLRDAWHQLLVEEVDATMPFEEQVPDATAMTRAASARLSRLIDAAAAARR